MSAIGALLTAIGLLAAMVARRGVTIAAPRDGAAQHLQRLFTLIALFLGLRLVVFAWDSPVIFALVMVVAAWLPLATLRLAEELVRRHAPRPLKILALGGAVGFSVLAMTLGLVWDRQAVIALAAFQGITMAGVLFHLFAQRSTLASAEQETVTLLALAFLASVPLLATDFVQLFPDLPFRGGSFAALIFVLACSRLVGEDRRTTAFLRDLAIILASGAVAGLACHLLGIARADGLALSALATASAALLLLIDRFAAARLSADGIIQEVARAGSSRDAILASHPLLAGSTRIAPDDLADFPSDMIEALAHNAIITRANIQGDDRQRDAAQELLDRHSASHLLCISRSPATFLAISGGPLSDARLSAELEIIARLVQHAK